MADKRKPDAHPSDKFILAMIVMAVVHQMKGERIINRMAGKP